MGDYGINQTFEYVELCLDSNDANTSGSQVFDGSNSDPNQIKWSWPYYYFTSKKFSVAGIKILSAEIPFVFDVITTNNNTFVYTDAGTPYTLTIPTGTYTGDQLAATLQTLIRTVRNNFNVTWSSQTLRFTFHQNAAITWSLGFPSQNTAYSPMGFLAGSQVSNTGINSEIISPVIAQVSGPYYLYINSQKIGSLINFNLPDGSPAKGIGPELCRVPINVQYGSIIFYTDPDPSKYFDFFAANQFDNFDFYLTLGSNQYQKPLDMKGSPWSIKLGLLVYRSANSDVYSRPIPNIKQIK